MCHCACRHDRRGAAAVGAASHLARAAAGLAYALQTASLLKADRNAAIRTGTDVSTLVDAPSRAIHSGATAQTLRIPDDVRVDALLPQTCRQRAALSTISFFADGGSCGGTIALTRLDTALEIRVNWLTGRIDIVSHSLLAN